MVPAAQSRHTGSSRAQSQEMFEKKSQNLGWRTALRGFEVACWR
uniref:Uncharacterized protein n=1 Tax=Anopheles albimanus TaxID=7167 RepID=A0A182FY53_ANOAL